MIQYKIATKTDMDLLMSSRLDMLRQVNGLSEEEEFSKELVYESRLYFEKGDETTVLAIDQGIVVGCATLCYISMMPTYSHPTGKRAHLMNVYTRSSYRRQGIGYHMLDLLYEEAKRRKVTEISLDATDMGRPLYEKYGFHKSEEAMVITV